MLIYKILRPGEWESFEALGTFDGSPDDKRDGFIHCSSRAQVAGTAIRIFGDEAELVIAAVDTEALGDSVRWEAASNGVPFPHMYAPLPREAVVAVFYPRGAGAVEETLSQL